ncbi:MAG: hypothetical protein NUV91_08790, partial [Candidatus Omnitrophica bacterium]|nr:hypothetical protein [Candidatus Omnitrophota bacterium]
MSRISLQYNRQSIPSKIISFGILGAFIFNLLAPLEPLYAQTTFLNLPQLGTRVLLSETFQPVLLKGLKVDLANPFQMDFIVDRGEEQPNDRQLNKDAARFIRYFLAGLTVPEKDLWVNLSPEEPDRIIPKDFGTTDMGRDLLAQDYLLKQITASLMYPEDEVGQKFWQRVYKKSRARYGTTDIPVNTFNKVWIVPEKAQIYENGNSVFVVHSRMKVMLEEDWASQHNLKQDLRLSEGQKLSNEIIREIILPEIEREVNQGRHFALLRQIYHALILAKWYKQALKESFLNKVYQGKNKVDGIDIEDKESKEKIYQQYLDALKKGVYSYIKEEVDPATQQMIPRKYFSGGAGFENVETEPADPIMASEVVADATERAFVITSQLRPLTHNDQESQVDQKTLAPAFDDNDSRADAQPITTQIDPLVQLANVFLKNVEEAQGLREIINRLINLSLPASIGRTAPQINRIFINDPTVDPGIPGHASDWGIHIFINPQNPLTMEQQAAIFMHELIAFMGQNHPTSLAFEVVFNVWLQDRT